MVVGAQKRILDAIEGPGDLKLLNVSELSILCDEIRAQILDTTSATGGHVASSLGAVELIVALHAELSCPTDKIVFDVGHQAYAHKLLTGRRDAFDTLRQRGGISGFPRPSESPQYDMHPSGHASDSLSVAMGLAKARDLRGTSEHIAVVIGDASLSGGMAFEALNHIGQEQLPILIVLNDNGMSISRPVGALVRHLGYLRTTSGYRQTREALQERMEASGPVAGGLLEFGRNAKESLKQFVVPHSMVFEQLGITCTAPVNGHDIAALREAFRIALRSNGPVLVHVVTKKGAGFAPAEENPEAFHGPGAFDRQTGEIKKDPNAKPKYTSVFGQALVREAARDERICAITAAMKDGTGLTEFARAWPTRYFDVGIAEEHAVGLAAGLAHGGMRPVVAIYSTFLQRALDQIIIDVALNSENVVFAVDRGGIVGADGATHNGVFDIAYLRMVPNMRVMCPSNEAELACMLHTALSIDGPCAVRYPRGEGEGVPVPDAPQALPVGVSVVRREGADCAILAFGRMVGAALGAAEMLRAEGVECRVVDMRWAKPLDRDAICAAAQTRLIVTVEEGVVVGGAGEGVADLVMAEGLGCPVRVLGIRDEFVEHGAVQGVLSELGLDAEGIAEAVRQGLR